MKENRVHHPFWGHSGDYLLVHLDDHHDFYAGTNSRKIYLLTQFAILCNNNNVNIYNENFNYDKKNKITSTK